MKPTKIGIVGCGNISGIYLKNCTTRFPMLDVVACADLVPERARKAAEEYGVPKACSTKELLAMPDVDIVLNLTIPKAHADVNTMALEHGKHVYVEKPLAVNRDDAKRVLDLAESKNLRIGCAPDTFLGGGIQTCRKLIEDGVIGDPVAATAFMVGHGHESWHPDPEFYYQLGGGPMLDMGPYYLTALVNLVGSIKRVSASTRISFAERLITSQPKHGQIIKVETPTHLAGTVDFENGAVGTIIMSFDVWKASLPWIQIHGTEGSLSVPDPNTFGGAIQVFKPGMGDWTDVPILSHVYTENSRGLGLADMATAIASGREHRASGRLAFHVLDAMLSFQEASEKNAAVTLNTGFGKPAALPSGLSDGEIDR